MSWPVADRLEDSILMSFGREVVQVSGDTKAGPQSIYRAQLGNGRSKNLGVLQHLDPKANLVGYEVQGRNLFAAFSGTHQGSDVLEVTETDLAGTGGTRGLYIPTAEPVESTVFFSTGPRDVLAVAVQATRCDVYRTERGERPLTTFQTFLGIGGSGSDQRAYGLLEDGRVAVVSAGGATKKISIETDQYADIRFATREGLLGETRGHPQAGVRPGLVIWTLQGEGRRQRSLELEGTNLSEFRVSKVLDTDTGTVGVFDKPTLLESSANPGPYLIARVNFETAHLSKLLELPEMPFLASMGQRLVIVENNNKRPNLPSRVWVQDGSGPLQQVGVLGSDRGAVQGISLSSDGEILHFATANAVRVVELKR